MLHSFRNSPGSSPTDTSHLKAGLQNLWEAIPSPSSSFPFVVTPATPQPDDIPGPSSRQGSISGNGLESRRSSGQSNSVFTSRASSLDGLGLGFSTTSTTPRKPQPRRQSFPFSLQLPFSRRRLLRYILLLSLPLLIILIITSKRRNAYDGSLIRHAGVGWSFPGWMSVRRESVGFGYWTANRRMGKRSGGVEGEGGGEGKTWEQRLQESLEDIGLVPVILDSHTMPKLEPLPARVEEMNENSVDMMLAENEGAARLGMPGFWGNPDVVGKSPFDHRSGLKDWQTGKRVLFLTDYHDYLERMNTHTYEIVDSALRHSGLSRVDIWGPGWNGWEKDLDVGENVRRRMWRIQWVDEQLKLRDEEEKSLREEEEREERRKRGIVWGREGDDWATGWRSQSQGQTATVGLGLGEAVVEREGRRKGEGELMKMGKWAEENAIPEGCPAEGFDLAWTFSDIFKQNDPKLTALPCGTLLAQQLGDCHSLNCLKEWYPKASNITVTKYAFEMLDIFNPERLDKDFNGMEMQLFGHSPDSANEWDFFPVEWGKREFDARMFGFTGSCGCFLDFVDCAIC